VGTEIYVKQRFCGRKGPEEVLKKTRRFFLNIKKIFPKKEGEEKIRRPRI